MKYCAPGKILEISSVTDAIAAENDIFFRLERNSATEVAITVIKIATKIF